jgi:hypothetical protein
MKNDPPGYLVALFFHISSQGTSLNPRWWQFGFGQRWHGSRSRGGNRVPLTLSMASTARFTCDFVPSMDKTTAPPAPPSPPAAMGVAAAPLRIRTASISSIFFPNVAGIGIMPQGIPMARSTRLKPAFFAACLTGTGISFSIPAGKSRWNLRLRARPMTRPIVPPPPAGLA